MLDFFSGQRTHLGLDLLLQKLHLSLFFKDLRVFVPLDLLLPLFLLKLFLPLNLNFVLLVSLFQLPFGIIQLLDLLLEVSQVLIHSF
jgi:hypothetical protein